VVLDARIVVQMEGWAPMDALADRCPELEAVFLFDGGGLLVHGAVLGRHLQFASGGTPVTILLPGPEHVPRELGQPPEHRESERAATLTAWNPQTGELHAAVVDTFEVRVSVKLTDVPLKDLIEQAFPVGLEVAERFLAWMRTEGGQYWLPSWHEGLEVASPWGRLVLAGTDQEVDPNARWLPGHAMAARSPERAASPQVIDRVLAQAQLGAEPPVQDLLLADAAAVADTLSVTAMWKYERRDTARAVLLAGIATEVKIKRTLMEHAPPQFHALLDVILDNPREIVVAAGQLLDKPMKAALGMSLREEDRALFKEVTERLFPLRNRVAHHGYEPTLAEAQDAVITASRLSGWLDRHLGAGGPVGS
jgi:hypothetical protein